MLETITAIFQGEGGGNKLINVIIGSPVNLYCYSGDARFTGILDAVAVKVIEDNTDDRTIARLVAEVNHNGGTIRHPGPTRVIRSVLISFDGVLIYPVKAFPNVGERIVPLSVGCSSGNQLIVGVPQVHSHPGYTGLPNIIPSVAVKVLIDEPRDKANA